ncbi:MAG: PAS domain S-box protein [Desulfovibrionales bacterium]
MVQRTAELRKSEARLRSILHAVPTGMGLISKRIFLDVNDRISDITGYSREELIGRDSQLLYPSRKEYDYVGKEKYRQIEMQGIGSLETQFKRKDGKVIDVLINFAPLDLNDLSAGVTFTVMDITESKRRENTLTGERRRFEQILDCFPFGVYIVDQNHRIEYLNPHMRRECGDPGTRRCFEFMHNLSAPCNGCHNDKVFQGQTVRCIGYLPKTGRDYEFIHIPLYNDDGTISKLEVFHDITERKAAEQALRYKQSMLERTERIAHIGSWEWDVEADMLTWSDELFRIYQRDPAMGAVSPAAFAEFVHHDDRVQYNAAVQAALSTGTPFDLEFRVLCPDGSVRHCLSRGSFEMDVKGKVLRLFGSTQDITEFKHAQERIFHLNSVLQGIRGVNQLIVREHDPDVMIREGCQLLVDNRGYSSALIVLSDEQDKPVSWAQAGMDAAFGSMDTMLAAGELPPCCVSLRTSKRGMRIEDRDAVCASCPMVTGYRKKDAMCVRLTHEGKSFGYLAVSMDFGLASAAEEQALFEELASDLSYGLHVVHMNESRKESELRRESLERQLIQAQKLESVGRLAGGVAHDFNNMLSVITGYAELALMAVEKDASMRYKLGQILKAADQSTKITSQLLTFARRQTISPKVLQLNETVEGMLKMLKRLIGEEIELVWKPGDQVWPVKMDPVQIDQVLVNLCINSRDAISGIGTITIETDNVSFDMSTCSNADCIPGDFVMLAVSDDGSGMDNDTLEKIFEPFFTTKELGKGTGLGLATIHGIVRQNNGFINVYSEPKEGTTFRVYLPSTLDELCRERGKKDQEIPVSRGETVLLVEDEPAILELSRSMLERLGYRVLSADKPSLAIRKAKEHAGEIDLLITDVVMPEMNGRELAERLLTIHSGVSQLFISGYTADVIAHRGVLDEGVNYLQKPFSMSDLAMKVRMILDQRNQLKKTD